MKAITSKKTLKRIVSNGMVNVQGIRYKVEREGCNGRIIQISKGIHDQLVGNLINDDGTIDPNTFDLEFAIIEKPTL